MTVRELQAKTILRKHKKIDSWFLTCYGMNLYRGCTHNCTYCDGRAEKYYVEGEFGRDVAVKVNAVEVLARELDPVRRRKPLKRCFLLLGGGVGDAYQGIDEKYQLSRRALKLFLELQWPVHVLTKSTRVLRDLDLLKQINSHRRVVVSFSFSCVDDDIACVFEPGVPAPTERLNAIKKLKRNGVACGMFLMPVIPKVTDRPEQILASLREAKNAGVVFGGMTLKTGRQMDHFLEKLKQYDTPLTAAYRDLYGQDKWGRADWKYYQQLQQTYAGAVKQIGVAPRMPLTLFSDVLSPSDKVIVLLEQIDYLLGLRNRKSPYGRAAWHISQLKHPVGDDVSAIRRIKGVGPTTENLVRQILETGTCKLYQDLMGSYSAR